PRRRRTVRRLPGEGDGGASGCSFRPWAPLPRAGRALTRGGRRVDPPKRRLRSACYLPAAARERNEVAHPIFAGRPPAVARSGLRRAGICPTAASAPYLRRLERAGAGQLTDSGGGAG